VRSWLASLVLVALGALTAAATAEPAAKDVFGSLAGPAPGEPRAIGGYARGCLAGGRQLATDGDGWQAMRLSRNRHWGHSALVAYVERLAEALVATGHPGLLVGDMAQPRGGPMRKGHASHQIGLDVDIWFRTMPRERLDADARETLSALSLLIDGTRRLDEARFAAFGVPHVVRTAAAFPEVDRIFVHPAIKRGLCAAAGDDRTWLRKVRPWWGHHYHFHVRLACPADGVDCVDQTQPPPGDGCGDDLAWWFTDEPWQPSTTPSKPPLRMHDLPSACRFVADAG
jgi:penicillin-insensitive murein endopeptidase